MKGAKVNVLPIVLMLVCLTACWQTESNVDTGLLDQAIVQHAERLLEHSDISGVYRSLDDSGQPCIKVMVTRKSDELENLVKETLGGLPFVLSESGPLEPK